jgi:hypothetical protein
MNDQTQTEHPTEPRSRESIFASLDQQFLAFHARRRLVRRVAAGVSIVGLIAAIGVALLRTAQSDAIQTALTQSTALSPRVKGETPLEQYVLQAESQPEYATLRVSEVADAELASLLRSTEAHWFVAEIDGRLKAFPLE